MKKNHMRQMCNFERIIFLTAAILLYTSNLDAQSKKQKETFPDYFPPYREWERRQPEELGADTNLLNEAINFAIENEIDYPKDLRIPILQAYGREPGFRIMGPVTDRGGTAGVVIVKGYIVASWGDLEKPDLTFSATKSYLSTVAGLAWDDGLFNVTDKVSQYVTDGTFSGAHNSKITWEHLLNQSSDWSGTLFEMADWADRPPRTGTPEEWQRREFKEPGSNYEYNDVRVNLLAYSLLQVMRKPLPVILKEQIMDQIGASTTWRWNGYDNSWVNVDGQMIQSVSGGAHFGGGLVISTLDHARFGLLLARNGIWNGKQLISGEWIRMATKPSPANINYGYMWWLTGGETVIEGINRNLFYATGMGGNYVVVDQEKDIVIVLRWVNPSGFRELTGMIMKAVN
jgi:CubicO group peptidase (beta-lactamase class C family)